MAGSSRKHNARPPAPRSLTESYEQLHAAREAELNKQAPNGDRLDLLEAALRVVAAEAFQNEPWEFCKAHPELVHPYCPTVQLQKLVGTVQQFFVRYAPEVHAA